VYCSATKVHPGKWVKNRYLLASEKAFEGWTGALLVGAHMRDCLIERHQRTLIELMEHSLMDKMQSRTANGQ
jgi:hypothetical protein